uniref:Uncharacterized protein n=1 Tax=Myotis lucifugus TaxID=59463 RepID=G1Q715_MYOLU
NFGSMYFLPTRQTLSQDPQSFLYLRARPTPTWIKDETGAYLIDSDPTCSGPADDPRHGKLIVNKDLAEGVLEEGGFYNLASLIKLIKDEIRERDSKTSQVPGKLPVDSGLGGGAPADGVHHVRCWKFELLVSTVSSYNDGSEDQGELLCVVSKERESQDVARGNEPPQRGSVAVRRNLLL